MSTHGRTRNQRCVRWALSAILLCVIAYCVGELWAKTAPYRQEAALRQEMQAYKPEVTQALPQEVTPPAADAPAAASTAPTPAATAPAVDAPAFAVPNQRILDLQSRNRDALGWLDIADTQIDYPFVQATDNERYLATDFDGQPAAAGTLFLDWRSRTDFQGFNHVIYGHAMKNGSMFGTLRKFADQAHFDAHPTGRIHLVIATYQLEIFAYLIVDAKDTMIYATHNTEPESRADFFDYVKTRAHHYRNIGLNPIDRIVTLSTCTYETETARIVLLARLSPIEKGD